MPSCALSSVSAAALCPYALICALFASVHRAVRRVISLQGVRHGAGARRPRPVRGTLREQALETALPKEKTVEDVQVQPRECESHRGHADTDKDLLGGLAIVDDLADEA